MTGSPPAGALSGQVVIVTGATGGLGRAVVKRLLGEGAVVAAAYRDAKKFGELLAQSGAEPGRLEGLKADVTSAPDVQEMVKTVVHKYGRIDALLNLAGAYRGGMDVASTEEGDWDFLMQTNLKSAFLCSKAVVPAMMKANAGRIVCVAARPAVENKGRAKSGAYAVSKAGVVVLAETIAEEVRKFNITVNCVLPGTIDTEANRLTMASADFSRWVKPEEIASVLLFLLAGEAAVVSGAAIPVYGKS